MYSISFAEKGVCCCDILRAAAKSCVATEPQSSLEMADSAKVTFQKPVFVPEKAGHSFTLLDVPIFEAPRTAAQAPAIDFAVDCSGQLAEFADAFLQGAAPYFSKPLPVPVFLQRVKHIWITSDFSSEELAAGGLLKWIPASVLFYKGGYELEWNLIEIGPLPEPVARPPEPVGAAGTAAPTAVGEQGEGGLAQEVVAPGPAVAAAAASAAAAPTPPLEEGEIPGPAPPSKAVFKQKVRKARLRAALAQMRAEKMAERYYLRYGNLDLADGTDSDSALSFEDQLS